MLPRTLVVNKLRDCFGTNGDFDGTLDLEEDRGGRSCDGFLVGMGLL